MLAFPCDGTQTPQYPGVRAPPVLEVENVNCPPVATVVVLSVAPSDRADAGIVRFKHWGVNQDDKQVFEGDRRMLIKRRSHWGDK
jgi:hypothetical protein